MSSPLLDILFRYGGAVATGLVVALIGKLFFIRQIQSKIHGYQGEIVKSHSRILELEAEINKLEKRIKELERKFPKVHLFAS